MTRFATTLLAAASLALAAPAAAQDDNACDPMELLYQDEGQTWIISDGLVDATQRMGGEYPGYFLEMWNAASDGNHGFDVEVEHAIHWFGKIDDAPPAETIGYLAEKFADADAEYTADKNALEDDIRAERRAIRGLQRKIRALRATINALVSEGNNRDPEVRQKVADARRNIVDMTAQLNAARADLRDLRQEHRDAARAVADLEQGVAWAKTLACVAEGRR